MVTESFYGGSRSNTACNALSMVRHRCDGLRSCSLSADDTLCPVGQAPPNMLIPALTVRYRCVGSNREFVRQIEKSATVTIFCWGLQ